MAEWVDYGSLKGPQGDKGDTGDQGPQGAKGDTGAQGPKGDTGATPVITMTATVDANVGTPSVNVQQGGTAENPTFSLAFASIKGEKGDKGDTGDTGPQGETGPQGPAGEDAQFPIGGEDGQSLVKSADGYGWADMLPETGGTLTGSVAVDTGTVEPNITLKRTVDGSPCEAMMRIDSEAVAGIRFKVNGETVNNLYLEQTKTRLSKPLDVASGGVPQNGTSGQILKKGASGAEWVDSIIVDATEASVAMRDSAAVVDDPANPTSGIVLKTDDTGKTVISGIDSTPVDEVHVEDTTGDSTGTLAVNVNSMKTYVAAHAGDALPEGGTDGQVLTKVSDGVVWQNVSIPPGYLRANGDGEVSAIGRQITSLNFQNDTFLSSLKVTASDFSGITAGSVGGGARLKIGCSAEDAIFTMMNKTVSSITDSISSSPAGNALTTDKAVADYVAANAGNPFPSYGGNEGRFLRCNEEQNTVMWDHVSFSDLTGTPSFTEPSSDTNFFITEGLGNSSVKTISMTDLQSYLGGSGGGGLELLWEGAANKLTSINIGVDLTEYSLVVFEATESSSSYSDVYPVVCPSPRVGSNYYTSHISGRYMFINIANVSTVVLNYSYIAYLRAVYGIKASGGGVAPDVLWEGNSSQTGTFDPRPYSRLEITGREATTNMVTESISAPFEAGKTSEGTGRFVFSYDPFSGGTAAFISGIEINVLKVTGYK